MKDNYHSHGIARTSTLVPLQSRPPFPNWRKILGSLPDDGHAVEKALYPPSPTLFLVYSSHYPHVTVKAEIKTSSCLCSSRTCSISTVHPWLSALCILLDLGEDLFGFLLILCRLPFVEQGSNNGFKATR